jgi:hypothetical protein
VRTALTIAFLGLYVVLGAGFQVLIHTCGGEVTVHVTPGKAEDPCGCSDMPEQDRCCTTQIVTVHLDDVQQAVTSTLPGLDHAVAIDLTVPHEVLASPLAVRAPRTIDTSPPSSISPHILNCTFLI